MERVSCLGSLITCQQTSSKPKPPFHFSARPVRGEHSQESVSPSSGLSHAGSSVNITPAQSVLTPSATSEVAKEEKAPHLVVDSGQVYTIKVNTPLLPDIEHTGYILHFGKDNTLKHFDVSISEPFPFPSFSENWPSINHRGGTSAFNMNPHAQETSGVVGTII
ncbi:hypothetical protein F5Y10DRAFT_42734 [Nemania abortiva]|nr:hypothetical protein F5Y10DRAFT_42734 [Nemania abortiva]